MMLAIATTNQMPWIATGLTRRGRSRLVTVDEFRSRAPWGAALADAGNGRR
jgi:hypothetical protein